MAERFEFASKTWLEETFRLFTEAAARHPDVRFSLCEVFTNVPDRLGPDERGRVAWHAFIREGRAECGIGEVPAEKVDIKTVGDWEALLPAARYKIDLSDPQDFARFQAVTERAAAEGRLERFGDRSKVPLAFVSIHNALADRTA
jgi:hypothetical protein